MVDDVVGLIGVWWENTIDAIVNSMLEEDDYVEYCIKEFNGVRCSKEQGCTSGDEFLDALCGDIWFDIALED